MSQESNIEAIVKLLDDPDEEIFSAVKNKLFDEGISVIKYLEKTWENSENPLIHQRIENLTQEINLHFVVEKLKSWAITGKHDLLEGAFWLAKYQYPDYDFASYDHVVNQIISDVNDELNEDLTPLEKVTLMNHIFFQVNKFTRTFTTTNTPQNFFLNNVIQTKKGNFFSLALLYGGIGQRLGMPLLPLNLPDNFALAYLNPRTLHLPINEDSALFYINPANKGAVFGRLEIDDFLKKINIRPEIYHYTPMHNIDAIILLLDYLILSFNKLGEKNKTQDFRLLQNNIRNG